MNAPATVNFEKLRQILESELDRPVTLKEATKTGNHLLNIYDILLNNRGGDDKILTDTTSS